MKFIIPITTSLLMTGTAFSALTTLDSATGTIIGTTTTYTVTGGNPGANGGGIGGADEVITISFSAPVDLYIDGNLAGGPALFSNVDPAGISNSFVADAGTWTFTAGADTPSFTPTVFHTISGSTVTTGEVISGGTHPSGSPSASQDWGELSISGITTLTWTVTDQANNETFRFRADAAAVPEPSSMALIALASLGLIRRKR